MKPNWVLSDEQCNIRFRRVRKEKGVGKADEIASKADEMAREGTETRPGTATILGPDITEIKEEASPLNQGGITITFTKRIAWFSFEIFRCRKTEKFSINLRLPSSSPLLNPKIVSSIHLLN